MKIVVKALVKFLMGLVIVGALLFLSAGTFNYMNGWLFIGLLFIPMFILGIFLLIKNPALLEKRLNAKEEQKTQKVVVAISGLLFIIEFIIAGLDFRFKWSYSYVPLWVVIIASVVFLITYALYVEVMRENVYLSRKVEVQENQKVIDTGLYGIVRHPMYAVTLWMFFMIPIILGSWWALISFSPYIVLLIIRIINEEKILEKDLDGYIEYKKRVKYKIIPFIW
ncbi:MAG TPA: isoprenylcysteine carboxylmethyltransferase family protein [Erysipelotrichaceae bacterium]|nr:isoprenylcysteine carboxylmethyltransferase family protein [Erysipelotrichaceae bacterium]